MKYAIVIEKSAAGYDAYGPDLIIAETASAA